LPEPTVSVDYSVQPAAHEDAQDDARAAARWLITAFAAVGGVMVSGIGLSSFAGLSDWRLVLGWIAFSIGFGSVIWAVSLVGDVLAPEPITLRDLAERQRRRNAGGPLDRDPLVEYLEGDPSFVQGIAGDAEEAESLIAAYAAYDDAMAKRFSTAETYWRTAEAGASWEEVKAAERLMQIADIRSDTMHLTVRRLERIAAAQQTVLSLRGRRGMLSFLAAAIAISIGAFAAIAGS
jgi:hypothetical protein